MSILLVGKKIVVYDVTTSSIGLVIFQGICAFFFLSQVPQELEDRGV